MRTVASPPEEDIVLNRQDFMDPDRARQLIGETLSRWDDSQDSWRQECIETALEKGREAEKRMPASHNSICVGVTAIYVCITPPTLPPDVETCIGRCLENIFLFSGFQILCYDCFNLFIYDDFLNFFIDDDCFKDKLHFALLNYEVCITLAFEL